MSNDKPTLETIAGGNNPALSPAESVVQEYLKSDLFTAKIQENVDKCIASEIHSMFSYGDLNKQIREVLKEKLILDFSKIEFPEYNRMIIKMVKGQVVNVLKEQSQDVLVKNLEEMLTPAPKEITVQEIVDIIREDQKDEMDPHTDERLTVEVEHDGGICDGTSIKIWDKEGKKSEGLYSSGRDRSPLIDIWVGKHSDGKISIIRTNNDLSSNLMTSNYGVEAKLYLMYCQGTVITDAHTCDDGYLDTSLGEDY